MLFSFNGSRNSITDISSIASATVYHKNKGMAIMRSFYSLLNDFVEDMSLVVSDILIRSRVHPPAIRYPHFMFPFLNFLDFHHIFDRQT